MDRTSPAAQLAARLREDPELARVGGEEREISVVFAELEGFTAFSEHSAASEVIAMLNEYGAVGVNTGPAVVGNVGAAEQQSFSAIGDTTNLAARLQAAAAAGTVVIGETTYAEVREHVDVEPLEPLAVKGKAEPMRAYVLRGVSTDSRYAAPSGRDGEAGDEAVSA